SGFVSGPPTHIIVDYKTGGNLLFAGEYDVLQNDVLDNFEIGYMTNNVGVWLEDPWGYLPLPLMSGRTDEVRMVMPLPKGTHWLGSGTIYIDTVVSNLTLFVSNTAQTANVISNVEIVLPEGLVGISDLTSLRGNPSYEAGSHVIRIHYVSGLSSNVCDTINFTFSNTYRAPTNLRITVRATHLSDHSAVVPSLLGEEYSTFPVSYPPVAVEGYFVGDNALYIVENEGVLTYRLMNRTFKSEVRKVLLTFETNTLLLFSNMVITNTRATVTRLETNSNQFLLMYSPGEGIGSQENEDIKMRFFYTLSNTGSIPLRSVVDLVSLGDGGTNVMGYETFSLDEKKTKMIITNSTWGIVCGSVFPGTRLVYVKMYGMDGVSIGLDDEGNPLSQTIQIGSGNYKLTHVPEGSYWLEFSAPYYRTIRKEIYVPANQTVRLPIVA
ncbi:MAG: carboxypeptidase-like regulatory domain-containing protein, partial [Brevinematales bacterium]